VALTRGDLRAEIRSDLFDDLDITAIEVTGTNSNLHFLIINVYNDDTNHTLKLLLDSQLPNLKTFICGDFNLHHPDWSGDEVITSTASESLVEWMTSGGFVLLNDPGVDTFE